jgi:hypothetical protein
LRSITGERLFCVIRNNMLSKEVIEMDNRYLAGAFSKANTK